MEIQCDERKRILRNENHPNMVRNSSGIRISEPSEFTIDKKQYFEAESNGASGETLMSTRFYIRDTNDPYLIHEQGNWSGKT